MHIKRIVNDSGTALITSMLTALPLHALIRLYTVGRLPNLTLHLYYSQTRQSRTVILNIVVPLLHFRIALCTAQTNELQYHVHAGHKLFLRVLLHNLCIIKLISYRISQI